MKLSQIAKYCVILMAIFFTASFASNAMAVSSTNSSKVKDFKLKPTPGKALRYSDISLAIRTYYPGVRPRVSKRKLAGKPNCFDVKFLYKNELRRVSFNCTATQLVMQARK